MAALPNSPLLSVEEYLNTTYDPDVEFVDGVLVERNVGDWNCDPRYEALSEGLSRGEIFAESFILTAVPRARAIARPPPSQ